MKRLKPKIKPNLFQKREDTAPRVSQQEKWRRRNAFWVVEYSGSSCASGKVGIMKHIKTGGQCGNLRGQWEEETYNIPCNTNDRILLYISSPGGPHKNVWLIIRH